ncbi:glucose-6-phosphate/phosphate translocator 1, chloroplastic [Fagus crenata]
MVCSVIRSVSRTIDASDLFGRKRCPVPPIQQSSLPLPALRNPAEQFVISVSRPLHVSSVENLSFKCEAADWLKPVVTEEVKSVIGVYLASWWVVVQNVGVLNTYPTTLLIASGCGSLSLVIMLIFQAMSFGKFGKILDSSISHIKTFFGTDGTTELINETEEVIEFVSYMTLKAGETSYIPASYFMKRYVETKCAHLVFIKLGGEPQEIKFIPEDFITYKKFVCNIKNGKLDVTTVRRYANE